MLSTLTYEELVENIVWFGQYPVSSEREDLRAAQISYHVVTSSMRVKDPKRIKFENFVLNFDKEKPKKQTWQEQLALMESFAQSYKASLSGSRKENMDGS